MSANDKLSSSMASRSEKKTPEDQSRSPSPVLQESLSSTGTPLESNNAASSASILTSSDKLTALPQQSSISPTQYIGPGRVSRSSSLSANNLKRGWRRSLDASTSFPSVPDSVDLDHSVLGHHNIWATPRNTAKVELNQGSPEGSTGKETPRQRVSFDSDRNSPNMRHINQATSHGMMGNDQLISNAASPAIRSLPLPAEKGDHSQHLSSPSQSRSRAASPLRLFHQWSSGLHRGHAAEDPFVPVDPFKFKSRFPFCMTQNIGHGDIETNGSSSSGAYDCDDLLPVDSIQSFWKDTQIFVADNLLREVYLNLLLRLPAMYFFRVARIFEDADVSRPDIERMINAQGGVRHSPTAQQTNAFEREQANSALPPGAISGIGLSAHVGVSPAGPMIHLPLPFPDEWTPGVVSPALIRFKHSWEAFIDSLLREWKTLNVVSALLASAILTIFQIPEAADDPLTRTFALLSLICALLSLSYGCIYIVRFGAMRSMFHASRWAEEAQKTKTFIWWNVWVLLATPAVWMAWAMLLFISSILSFVWRTGSIQDPEDRGPLGTRAALGPRIAITLLFVLGMVYLAMIIKTLRKYGAQQNPVRALLRAGSPSRNGPEVISSSAVKERGPKRKTPTARNERSNPDTERRGRERERSTSTRMKHRKGRSQQDMRPQEESKTGGMKGILGIMGLVGHTVTGEQEEDIELEGEIDVKDSHIVDVHEV